MLEEFLTASMQWRVVLAEVLVLLLVALEVEVVRANPALPEVSVILESPCTLVASVEAAFSTGPSDSLEKVDE